MGKTMTLDQIISEELKTISNDNALHVAVYEIVTKVAKRFVHQEKIALMKMVSRTAADDFNLFVDGSWEHLVERGEDDTLPRMLAEGDDIVSLIEYLKDQNRP